MLRYILNFAEGFISMFNENGVFFKYVEKFIEGKISLQDIEEFEKNYNIKLPSGYKEFLIKYNGIILGCDLYINNLDYSLYNIYLDDKGIGGFDVFEDLSEIIRTMKEYLTDYELNYKIDIVKNKKILPIAGNMSAHSNLGIGYGKDNFGKIYAWLISGFDGVYFLCDSFKEFIEGYYLIEIDDEGEIIGTEKIFTIDNTI